MKLRLSLSIAFTAAVFAAQAVVVYDGIGAGVSYGTATGGLPRGRMADSMSFADPGAGMFWSVTSIDIGITRFANTFTNVTAEVILWNEWNGAGWNGAGTNVFRNEAGRETFNLGAIAASGARTVTFTSPILMSAYQNVGIEVLFLGDGIKTDAFTFALQDAAPTVGSSTNLFYRDADNNDSIQTTDGRTITGWTNTNAMLRVHAQPVPEPGTLAALGLGAVALLRRRRR